MFAQIVRMLKIMNDWKAPQVGLIMPACAILSG